MASIISAGTTSGTSLNLSADTSGVLQLATNGTTTAVTIDTSQNVGIGTASPSGKFNVGGGRSNFGANSEPYSIGLGYTQVRVNSGQTVYIGASDSATPDLLFSNSAGTERMRITNAGDVGIGTSSPASLLHITGNDPTIRLTDNAGSPAATWSMRSTDGNFAIRDVTNSVDRATFNANGCMALTGANLTATGIGITFPATQSASSDANTLDDYEEGTWTPSLFAGGANMVSSYNSDRNGAYTKVGNTVFWMARISDITKNAQSGALTLEGLPFTTNSSYFYSNAIWAYSGITSTGTIIMRTNVGGTNCVFQSTNTSGAGSPIEASAINGGNFNVILTGFYTIN
jgi:hypothetical protein